MVGTARSLGHGQVLLRLRPRSNVEGLRTCEPERGPRVGLVEREALDAQSPRRRLLCARLLLRQRAAGFSADAVHAPRRPAPLRNHRQLRMVGAAMRVTAEMSLYPLQGQPLEKILAFIEIIAS